LNCFRLAAVRVEAELSGGDWGYDFS